MKLSIDSSTPYLRFGAEGMVRSIKNAGFDAMDFSFYDIPADRSVLGEDYMERALELKGWLEKYGLACNQAHAPYNFSEAEPFDMTNPRYVELVRSLEFAAFLGSKNIIVHAVRNLLEGSDLFEVNYRFYKSLEPFCRRFNIHVAVENLFRPDSKRKCFTGIFGTPEELSRMVKMLDSEWFVACVDVGHAALAGMEPEDFLAGMSGDVVRCLHIQDTDYLTDTHTIPYIGKHNWKNITRALADIGYSGDFTLEVLYYLGGFPDELLEDALKLAERTGRRLIAMIEEYRKA